jgi:regulator of nonsense transcripts 2
MTDDFFRIRLVATLLETCGIFFNRGAAGKKLDYFLSFLQVRICHWFSFNNADGL